VQKFSSKHLVICELKNIHRNSDEKAMPQAWTRHGPGASMVQGATKAGEIGIEVAMHAAQPTAVHLNGSNFTVRSVPTVQAVQPTVRVMSHES
jgi:hypothetical protein